MSRPHVPSDFDPSGNAEFPLRDEGEVWYQGWDIPGHWAIDAQGRPFADFGAHGCCMRAMDVGRIISELESSGDVLAGHRLRMMSGRKPALPPWTAAALSQGWTPPPEFRREDYE